MDLITSAPASLDEEQASRLRELLAELGLQAAERRFAVAPNPCVGAAVLSDGVEIGRGFHQAWGGAHAEKNALEAARKSGVPRDRWDTLVVTLEPCSSHGKTPPCTDAILAAGIRRVVVGAVDPDPRHRGVGLRRLHEAGLAVFELRGASPLAVVAPHFESWTRHERLRRPRPWTLAKWAQTRTGQLRPPEHEGDGRWISGSLALDEVQVLRGRVDAVVTGIGTVLADDPWLTVRPPGDLGSPPLRVVLDSSLRTSPDAHLFADPADRAGGAGGAGGAVHLFCRPGPDQKRHRALVEAGARVHVVRPGDDGRLSLREVARGLWDLGARRVLLEAGPTLTSAWFEIGFVDQVAVVTGDVNGGEGPTLAEWLQPARLQGVLRRELGPDAVLEAFVAPERR